MKIIILQVDCCDNLFQVECFAQVKLQNVCTGNVLWDYFNLQHLAEKSSPGGPESIFVSWPFQIELFQKNLKRCKRGSLNNAMCAASSYQVKWSLEFPDAT